MSKNRKYLIGAALWAMIALLFIIFVVGEPEWEPPTEDWWIRFESIEEIEEIHRLLDEGSETELLEFIAGTNSGDNLVNSRRDMEYFIEIIEETILPVSPNWVSLSYNHNLGNVFIMYDFQDTIILTFSIRPRGGDETFDEIMERINEIGNFTAFTDISETVASFSNRVDWDRNSLRIGNGVEVFSFYDQWGYYSIEEWESDWELRLSLNIDGYYAFASLSGAPDLESAFEILANIEFSMGGGWFDNEQ